MSLATTVTAPTIKRPRVRRRFPHVTMILAWVVFWLNTAFFPCCEAVAAFSDHSANVSQAASAAQPAHDPDETHTDRPDHSPYSPCGYSLSAQPTNIGVLAIEHSPLKWLAIDAPVAPGLTAVIRSENLASLGIPPPFIRPYLREQRLLL